MAVGARLDEAGAEQLGVGSLAGVVGLLPGLIGFARRARVLLGVAPQADLLAAAGAVIQMRRKSTGRRSQNSLRRD